MTYTPGRSVIRSGASYENPRSVRRGRRSSTILPPDPSSPMTMDLPCMLTGSTEMISDTLEELDRTERDRIAAVQASDEEAVRTMWRYEHYHDREISAANAKSKRTAGSARVFVCHGCGDAWDQDPRLIVPCPTCHAKAGATCVRPSEHRTTMPHKARRERAFAHRPCSCLAQWENRCTQPELPFAVHGADKDCGQRAGRSSP